MVFKTKRNIKKRRGAQFNTRKKQCRFCVEKIKRIDYKDVKRLESFIRERGKVTSPRGSGNCAKHQRMMARALRKARFIALIPYVRL